MATEAASQASQAASQAASDFALWSAGGNRLRGRWYRYLRGFLRNEYESSPNNWMVWFRLNICLNMWYPRSLILTCTTPYPYDRLVWRTGTRRGVWKRAWWGDVISYSQYVHMYIYIYTNIIYIHMYIYICRYRYCNNDSSSIICIIAHQYMIYIYIIRSKYDIIRWRRRIFQKLRRCETCNTGIDFLQWYKTCGKSLMENFDLCQAPPSCLSLAC